MTIIGVDPGLSGALAFINTSRYSPDICNVFDMPTVSVFRNKKNKKDVEYEELGFLIAAYTRKNDSPSNPRAYVEKVGAMAGQGTSSMYAFGKATGAILGAMGAFGVKTKEVLPGAWKKHFGLIGKDKDASRVLAIDRFPNLAERLNLKKHHGRADALLIALYGREVYGK